MSGLHLKKHSALSSGKEIAQFINPDIVVIPIAVAQDTNFKVIVEKGDYVYKGQEIATRSGFLKTPIISSVSGTIKNIIKVDTPTLKQVDAFEIENDLKERTLRLHAFDFNSLSREKFVEILRTCAINGMGGAGFPTYIKYDLEKPAKCLLVNAVECEPYITADQELLISKTKTILQAIKTILRINEIPKAVIAVKKSNVDAINAINQVIEEYPDIELKLVLDKYPMGWERALIKEALKLKYDKLPIEKGIIVNNVSTVFAIHEALVDNKPLIDRVVTFTGPNAKEPQNIRVKIGTRLKDLIAKAGGINNGSILIAGGPMMGNEITEDMSITSDINCILVLPNRRVPEETECIKCGKCCEVCPVSIAPSVIKQYASNIEKIKDYSPEKCIGCGLCTFVCPAKINLRDIIQNAKKEVTK